jgi:peptidoglycan/xylan/chitin deacetylase (PgdA/CDA1 family)
MVTLKRLIKRAVASRAGWPLVSLMARDRGVTVLMYHRIKGDDSPFEGITASRFRQQMLWLRRHCTPIRPEELASREYSVRRPSPPVLITFDDGYRDYYQNAFPILQELEIPSIVFLATSFMDDGGLVWTEGVTWAVSTASSRKVVLPWSTDDSFDLSSNEERARMIDKAKLHLKQRPDAERKQELSRLYRELGVSLESAQLGRQMMTWDEVRTIEKGFTQIGGHSHTHPILSQVDAQQMNEEIKVCRERIESQTNTRPRYFAYPNGRRQDFTDLTKQLLRKHGFEIGFSTIPGIHSLGMDEMEVRRQPTWATNDGDFACLVAAL